MENKTAVLDEWAKKDGSMAITGRVLPGFFFSDSWSCGLRGVYLWR